MSAQESLTRNILVDESVKSDNDAYLPVIICEYSGDSSGYKTTEIISALDSLDESAKSALNEALLPQFENIANQTGFLEWQELHNEFEKQLWASKKPPRVKEVAMELFKADKLKTVNH
mgnify:FL=1